MNPPKYLLFISLLIICSSLSSQILNFEKIRSTVDTSRSWNLSLDARLDFKRKIATSTILHTGVNNYYLSKKHGYYLIGDLNLNRVNGENIFNQGFAHSRVVLNRTKRVSYESFVQMQYDLGKSLKSRYLGGANVRLHLLNDTLKVLSIGSGVFYEDETWLFNQENTSLFNRNIKSNNYISTLWKINDWSQFVLTSYYQAPYEDFFRGRIMLESNLIMKFTDRFNYLVTFSLASDRNPVVEAGRLVYHLSTGFRYVIH